MRRSSYKNVSRYRTDKTDTYGLVHKLFRRAEEIDPEEFYCTEIEQFQRGLGDWAVGCCPFHGDKNPSFAMHMQSGGYICHATSCGERGGDIVGFVSALQGVTRRGAIHWLEENQWI